MPARRRGEPGGYAMPEPSTGRWRGTRQVPRLTKHACQRMIEMGVGLPTVAAILTDPEVEYGDGSRRERPYTAQRGSLAVGFMDDPVSGIVVLTVLHRTQDRYVRAR